MPRYYFHLHENVDVRDSEGTEFTDIEVAKTAAITSARDLMSEDIRWEGFLSLSHHIEITGTDGTCLCVIRFGDYVTIRP